MVPQKKLHKDLWNCGKIHEIKIKDIGLKVEEEKNNTYACSLCSKEFDRRCDLRLHKR